MNHLDFLRLADDLKSSPDEARRRSSVSRGYYAFYHHIRTYLVDNSLVRSGAYLSHHKLYTFLLQAARNSGRQEFERLCKNFDSLREQRERADYRVDLPTPSIKTCETIVRSCHKNIRYFDSQKGQDLIDGVRTYLTQIRSPIPYHP